jgi:hypothetical protein
MQWRKILSITVVTTLLASLANYLLFGAVDWKQIMRSAVIFAFLFGALSWAVLRARV